MKINRETFCTDGQWRKFIKVSDYFKELIKLYRTGHVFYDNYGQALGRPFIDGYMVGFKTTHGNNIGCNILYVGATTDLQHDKPWVDTSVTELKKEIRAFKRVKINLQ